MSESPIEQMKQVAKNLHDKENAYLLEVAKAITLNQKIGRDVEREHIIKLLGDDNLDALCEELHDSYEIAAKEFGWNTQERSQTSWAELPVENRDTMRWAVKHLMLYIKELINGENK